MKRSAPMKRTALNRTAKKAKKRPATPCSWSSRCKTRPTVVIDAEERYCGKHATWLADALVGTFVKTRDNYRCQLVGFNDKPCYMPAEVYWCHLIPKGRYRATRWDPTNAVTGCAGHHAAFDNAPREKELWCRKRLGSALWDVLDRKARLGSTPDVADVIREFRTRVPA